MRLAVLLLLCAGLLLLAAGPLPAAPLSAIRIPVENAGERWIRALGADTLAARNRASARLLALGPRARGPVRRALASPDPEIRHRARELWKTLRWQLLPGAEADIADLLKAAANGGNGSGEIPVERWRQFTKKHGAAGTLRLLAELKLARRPPAFYLGGLRAALETAAPAPTAGLIARMREPAPRVALLAMLEELPADDGQTSAALAGTVARIHLALWNYRAAYAFAQSAWERLHDEALIAPCAVAADRGHFTEEIWASAPTDFQTPAKDARTWSAVFYTGLAEQLQTPEAVRPLLKRVAAEDFLRAAPEAQQSLARRLLTLGWSEEAVALLQGAATPDALALRSLVRAHRGEADAAEADWRAALEAVALLPEADREGKYFALGELLTEEQGSNNDTALAEALWRRAEAAWRRIVEMEPKDSTYDANAYFRLSTYAERQHRFAEAADWEERGLALSKGPLVGKNKAGAWRSVTPVELQREIAGLRARAAKSLWAKPR